MSEVDFSAYIRKAKKHEKVSRLTEISHEILERAIKVGLSRDRRSGTFFLIDRDVVLSTINDYYKGAVEIMSSREAIKRGYGHYFWRILDKRKSRAFQWVDENLDDGYFVLVHEGANVDLPLQTCMLISTNRYNQNLHNVIVVEDHAHVNFLAGCTIHKTVSSAFHLGVPEIFVGKNAYLNYTMIHNWGEKIDALPRTGVFVGHGGMFISNYILTSPVKYLNTAPKAYVKPHGKAVISSILYLLK